MNCRSGYNIAARNMGIRHTVSKDLQVEPQGTGTDDMDGKFTYSQVSCTLTAMSRIVMTLKMKQ